MALGVIEWKEALNERKAARNCYKESAQKSSFSTGQYKVVKIH